jgi:hypothetical protein
VVTCRSGRLPREQAERAGELLARMRVPVVGAALNGVRNGSSPVMQLVTRRPSPYASSGGARRRRAPEAVDAS